MKKSQADKQLFWLTVAILLLAMQSLSADEKVAIETEEQLSELGMGWKCLGSLDTTSNFISDGNIGLKNITGKY